MLRILNIAPSTQAKDKRWFATPWKLEVEDRGYMAYLPTPILVAGEDGDNKVIRHAIATAEIFEANKQMENTIAIDEANGEFHNEVGTMEFICDETRHAFCDMVDNMDADISEIPKPTIVTLVVSYSNHQIYKSTLVSQLNGNPFLSKIG